MLDEAKQDYLSRSAIADKLNIPLKDLTQLMIEAGWIKQEGKQWRLTAKGEFEGGIYRQSLKYGKYIAWPSQVLFHPMIDIVNNAQITSSSIAKKTEVPARLLNRLFAHAGWLEPFGKGWKVTGLGKQFGGLQSQDQDSGNFYVTWPNSLQDDEVFQRLIRCLFGEGNSLDGRGIKRETHRLIANWLYLLDIRYCYCLPLSLPTMSVAPDFYLSNHRLVIDYWPSALNTTELATQLNKREVYRDFEFKFIEVSETKLSELDHTLTRQFTQQGLTIY